MLKVAASDYDGTLFRDDIITARDAEAIRKWRAAGHKFGVVSGRDHGMLMPQLKHYGVEYDTWPAITAAHQRCSRPRPLGSPHRAGCPQGRQQTGTVRKSFHFSFSSQDRTYLCHDLPGTWVWREAKEWDYPIVPVTEDDIEHLPQTIHQYSLGFTNPDDAWQLVNRSTPISAILSMPIPIAAPSTSFPPISVNNRPLPTRSPSLAGTVRTSWPLATKSTTCP